MKPAIRVENLAKQYRIGTRARGAYRNLTESIVDGASALWRGITGRRRGENEEGSFWALRDVSFEVQPGEVLGIIGRNGAGKSTLLKILSRITEPTSGQAVVRGRMGSLLEVGTGFHPELTGRENIFLNGSILGMSKAEIQRKFDEIVAFAEVEEFLDTPVKRYSSGMYVRLAFAVAAHLEPEILMVDEVLAVGDVAFQGKCIRKIREVGSHGRTVVFVSHNTPAIRNLTERCVYLQQGKVVCVDDTNAVLNRYVADAFKKKLNEDMGLAYYRRGNLVESSVHLSRVWFTDLDGEEKELFNIGESFALNLRIESSERHPEACLSMILLNENGERAVTVFSRDAGYRLKIHPGTQEIRAVVRGMPLSPGRYTTSVGLNRSANSVAFDVIVDYPAFEVTMPEVEAGAIDWPQRPWGAVHWADVAWEQSP